MKSKPLVSVIMPFYNAANYIEAALKSIINQTYDQLEIILVDDASTDNSNEIIYNFSTSNSNIHLFHNSKNLGLAASLNIAIEHCTGQFIARMDADDIMIKTRIEKQINYLLSHPSVDVLGGSLQYFGQSKYYNRFPNSHEDCRAQLCFNVCFGHPAVMFRASVFEQKSKLYNVDYKQYSEEYDLWCRLSFTHKFANLKDTLILYRTYPEKEKAEAEKLRRQNSIGIRSNYVTQVFKNYNNQYLTLHHKISRYTLDNIADINHTIRYFNYLLQLETELNRKSLKKILAIRFFDICYTNIHLGSKIHWIYIKSGYWKTYLPSIFVYLKFIIKTILAGKR